VNKYRELAERYQKNREKDKVKRQISDLQKKLATMGEG
jgi:hypothetical protein